VFAELHDAIDLVVRYTNELGAAVATHVDFERGWEQQEPIVSLVARLGEELNRADATASAILRDEFGAAFDEDFGWEFMADTYPLSPAVGSFVELTEGVYIWVL
jgi:hypothetical protein